MKAPKMEKKEYEVLPENIYPARLYEIVHIGTIKNYMGVDRNTIRFTFELPSQMRKSKDDEPMKPMVIGQDYTFSMFEKSNLRPVVQALLGKTLTDDEADEFDVGDVIGKTCLLNIIHKTKKDGSGKKYHVIGSAVRMMDDMIEKPAINPQVSYWVEAPDKNAFDKLPAFVQKRIVESKEYRVANGTYVPETTEEGSMDSLVGELQAAEDEYNGL